MTESAPRPPARLVNPDGRSPVVLVCDHAMNWLPPRLGTLGLDPAALDSHIAWDPGAREVATLMAERLDARLVLSTVSRLVVDPNRDAGDPDAIVTMSETTEIPGNRDLPQDEVARRFAEVHAPFHALVAATIDDPGAPVAALVSVHSFTPVYRGTARPWHVGIVHDDDVRLAGPMLARLSSEPGLVVGDNEPYAPSDRVFRTLARHGAARGLATAMIEIRNDLIRAEAAQRAWAWRLCDAIRDAMAEAGLAAEQDARGHSTWRA